MSSTMPLFTACLSLVLLGTGITRFGALGLVVGFAGTAVLASPSLDGDARLIGAVALLLSAVAWAFGTVFMKWKDFSAVTPIMLVGVQLGMSAGMLVPVALLVEGAGQTDFSLGLFVPLLYAAIPANAVTFALLATVVRRATPTQAASTAYMIPLFGVFFGWLIRDELLGRDRARRRAARDHRRVHRGHRRGGTSPFAGGLDMSASAMGLHSRRATTEHG